jgi:hypothetical protein
MQQVQSLPTLMFGAILALGAAVAYGLHRVSAEVAAVTVLSCSVTIACLAVTAPQVADQ